MDSYTLYLLTRPKSNIGCQVIPNVRFLPEKSQTLNQSTQTCLRRTHPDSTKLKMAESLGSYRLYELRPNSYVKPPPMPPCLHGTGSKLNYGGKKMSADGEKIVGDLLKEKIKIKNMSPLEPAHKHCKHTKPFFNNNNGGKLTPEKVKSLTKMYLKDESSNTESSYSRLSRTSVKSTITGKNADNLHRVVRSHIEMQEDFRQSINKVTKLTNRLIMTADPQLLTQDLLSDTISCESFDLDVDGSEGNMEQPSRILKAKSILNAQVIAPILRHVQRHKLKSLREEIKIIEYLERGPNKIDEIYKSFNR